MRTLAALLTTLAITAWGCGGSTSRPAWTDRPVQATRPAPSTAKAPSPEVEPPLVTANQAAVQAQRLGVLLPLSGQWASVGNDLKVAIELARADLDKPPELLFFDTAGDPSGAERAVEAAASSGVVAILGPVGVHESAAAAKRAASLRVPIALLAAADGADPAAGVFRLLQSPADEARLAARLAADVGYGSVAVFAPSDEVGIAQTEAFVGEAGALGLTVTARDYYQPGATDLEADLKRLLGLVPETNPRLKRHLTRYGRRGWKTFSPEVTFQLLYVPDSYVRGALVASYLPYLGVELSHGGDLDPDTLRRKHGGQLPQVVQLLGSSGWNHPSLLVRGGRAVEGALLVDLFSTDESSEFTERYRVAAKRQASAAVAQTYDGAHLVLAAWTVASATTNPRESFVRALQGASIADGACGAAVVGPDGEVVREGVVFEVSGGSLVRAPW